MIKNPFQDLPVYLLLPDEGREYFSHWIGAQGFHHLYFEGPPRDAQGPFLSINTDQKFCFDLQYFCQHAQNHFTYLCRYQINHQQDMVLGDWETRVILQDQKLAGEYHDGLVSMGVLYVPPNQTYDDRGAQSRYFLALPVWTESPLQKKLGPALFLDRDGILNDDSGYPTEITHLRPLEEIVPLLTWAQQKVPLIVLSNQSAMARGFLNNSKLSELEKYLDHYFRQRGVLITDWFYCPYHFTPDSIPAYRRHSLLRKPYPGMALLAAEKHHLSLSHSMMIGDKVSDTLLLPGLETLLLRGRYEIPPSTPSVFSEFSEILKALKQKWP
jgi:D-glycero-D-manno-heptose 1,7-bisphosphate phosphatase